MDHAANPDRSKPGPLYVISTFTPDDGPLFWNHREGFGDLSCATVFTEALPGIDCGRGTNDLPIADNQPEWEQLPAYPQ